MTKTLDHAIDEAAARALALLGLVSAVFRIQLADA
jgi:hypothetical protein